MADELALPGYMRSAVHIAAFEQIWQERTGADNLDMSELMMYLVDAVNQKALPYLADQFDIMNTHAWAVAVATNIYAGDDADMRSLIKAAIKTISKNGTVGAVKRAIAFLGFDPNKLVQRCGTNPDYGWAQFKLSYHSTDTIIINDAALMLTLQELIIEAKNERSQYLGLEYNMANINDMMTTTDEITGLEAELTIQETFDVSGFKYNGQHKYDGSKKYRPGVESFNITII